MNEMDRLYEELSHSDLKTIRKATNDGGRRGFMAWLILHTLDAEEGVEIRTAKNGKKYPINTETGEIPNGPMKGVKVGTPKPSAASMVGAKKSHEKPEHPEPGTRSEKPPVDKNGKPFKHTTLNLHEKEYGQVMHEMNDDYDRTYKHERIFIHSTVVESGPDKGKYFDYYVENHGFNDYNIFDREENDG